MNYSSIQIVLQEVPGEISICFSICGCQIKCKGCHSPILWKENNGQFLSETLYVDTLKKYKEFASCVLFMGGEWHKDELISKLQIAEKLEYKTCLYTGEDNIDEKVLEHLTWIKTGKWNEKLGGLNSPSTNQKFIETQINKNLNHLFLKNY